MKPELMAQLMHRALTEELGLVIETNNPKQLQINMDVMRKGMAEPGLSDLLFALPSTPNTLYITKRSVELDP